MNIYFAKFFKIEKGDWHWVIKAYRAYDRNEARDNAEKDWEDNFQGWEMSFTSPNYFDKYGSAKIIEFSK